MELGVEEDEADENNCSKTISRRKKFEVRDDTHCFLQILETKVTNHSSICFWSSRRYGKPQNSDVFPAASLSRFTKAEKEETQFPMKCAALPRMARSTGGLSGFRWYSLTCKAAKKSKDVVNVSLSLTPIFHAMVLFLSN